MKKIFLFLFIFSAEFITCHACLNYYYTLDNEGHFHQQDGIFWHFDKNFNQQKIVAKLSLLEKKLNKEHAYTLLSDYAVGLMKLGKTKEAQEILAVLYKHYPNEYKLASNLGTAYELIGEVDSALKYIKRGLELNPNDHEGSEWIHVKILEAKQKLKKNPNYLQDNTVLQLTDKQMKDKAVSEQIEIQVRERFPFSQSGNDAIMASLMIDLGDAYAHSQSIEYAKAFYDIAKEYYGDKSDKVITRIGDMKKLQHKYADKQLPVLTDYESRNEEQQILKEGEHNRLRGVRYTHIMDDNADSDYEVKWEKINTNVDSLLAKVDITRTAEDIKAAAIKDTSDSLQFVKDEVKEITSTEQKNKSRKSDSVIYYVLAGAIALAIGLYYSLLRKK